jgi:transposase
MEQPTLDTESLIFLDEFGINEAMTPTYARAPIGWRAEGSAPGASRGNTTLMFGVRAGADGPVVVAPILVFGAVDSDVMAAYAEANLGPELRPGDRVVMDNNNPHYDPRVEAAIAKRGASIKFLPPYSPDFTLIENCGSKVKQAIRKAAARVRDALVDAAAAALRSLTSSDVLGYLIHAGYCPKRE